jgi:maleylpyruvate isomerase
MSKDLAVDPCSTIGLCQAAHLRLLVAVGGITDEQVRGPSRLPNWTIGHVLTHIARNADGHARRLDGALRGEDLPRYAGGTAQRNSDISDGAQRPAAEVVADLAASQARLDQIWERSVAAGWPNRELLGNDKWPTIASPSRRLREVEMHHVDLGLGYEPSDWPEEYVEWELPMMLGTVPGRLRNPDDGRRFVAWLSGRSPDLGAIDLGPWS